MTTRISKANIGTVKQDPLKVILQVCEELEKQLGRNLDCRERTIIQDIAMKVCREAESFGLEIYYLEFCEAVAKVKRLFLEQTK